MFLVLAGSTLLMLRRLARQARRYPELKWVVDLSDALQSGLAVFLTCGAFVGLAFQPMFWYFVSMSLCLNAYMWRVEHMETTELTGWRAMRADLIKPPVAETSGWRKRKAVSTTVPP